MILPATGTWIGPTDSVPRNWSLHGVPRADFDALPGKVKVHNDAFGSCWSKGGHIPRVGGQSVKVEWFTREPPRSEEPRKD